jgi:hypothetical protein
LSVFEFFVRRFTEKTNIAAFTGKNIAESRTRSTAWEMLMGDDTMPISDAIYGSEDEKGRFRQLVVSSVMATDGMDQA